MNNHVRIFAITANGTLSMSKEQVIDEVRDEFVKRGFSVGEFDVEHVDDYGVFGHLPLDGVGVPGLVQAGKTNIQGQNVKVYIHSSEHCE